MKKTIYIFLVVVFWVLISFIIHIAIEIPVIWLMVSDMEKYSFGLNWEQLMSVHLIYTIVLLVAGIIAGLHYGNKWYKYIYIDKKYTGKWFKK